MGDGEVLPRQGEGSESQDRGGRERVTRLNRCVACDRRCEQVSWRGGLEEDTIMAIVAIEEAQAHLGDLIEMVFMASRCAASHRSCR